jgi:hypothetical protein
MLGNDRQCMSLEHKLTMHTLICVLCVPCVWHQDRLECVHQRREERLAEVQRRHLASDRAQKEAKERRDAMSQEVTTCMHAITLSTQCSYVL